MFIYIIITIWINVLCINLNLNIVKSVCINKIPPIDDIIHFWGFFNLILIKAVYFMTLTKVADRIYFLKNDKEADRALIG